MKKCKVCKGAFKPRTTTQRTCCLECAIQQQNEKRLKQEKKDWRIKKRIMKERLKTRSDWLKEAQVEFNRFIRLRDKDLGCISCGVKLGNKYDAGHYRSVGGFPEFRFDENNVHAQCVRCNQLLSGNLIEYRINLISRIGKDEVERLEKHTEPKKYTIQEIKDIKEIYKKKQKKVV